MKTLFKLILVICFSFNAQAQSVHWAFKVLEFSSQKFKTDFSANQLLGNPNVYPDCGSSALAWEPDGKLREEFVKVGFVRPIKAKKIIIVETFNPGYITHVYAYDASGVEVEIKSYQAKATEKKCVVLEISASEIDYYVYAIKIVVESPKNTVIGIDAIGITDSDKPIEIKRDINFAIKSNMVLSKLEPTVNSPYIELGPIMSPDGKILYFSRRSDPANVGGKDDLEDIWFSDWDTVGKKWQQAKNIGIPLNNKHPNFINSISPDGNTVLVGNSYSPTSDFIDDGVSISHRTDTGWTEPVQLIIEDEYNDNSNANFYLSNTQKVLLMSVQRTKDTYGDLDLYVSFIKPDKTWTKPLNLGPTINTIGSEVYVFLASDNKTVYFASTGHNGYGGTDIYVTHRLDNSWQKWSKPENLGPRVNSPADETYFTMSASGDKALFTSQGSSKDDQDMYALTVPAILQPNAVVLIRGQVLNSKTKSVVPNVKIIFEDLETGKEIGVAQSSPLTGKYEIILPSGAKYGYLASANGFISVGANIDLKNQKKYVEKNIDLMLTPAEVGEKIVLNNIFFDFDKALLKKESFPELNRLSVMLQENATMTVEIAGYTDNIGDEAYNDMLSAKRAEAVAEYLMKQANTDKSRIVLKHYGEQKPIADNKDKKGRKLNRRVEFKILTQ